MALHYTPSKDTGNYKYVSFSAESDLRIIVLGKSLSDTSNVGNIILGRSVFETEDPVRSVALQCDRVRGHVKGRCITIINAPHLFHQNLSHHQLTLCLKECVSLSAPGPHVIMLIVQPEDFIEKDKARVDQILSSLSEEAHKYTMIVTTQSVEIGTSVDQDEENVIKEILTDHQYRHLNLSDCSQVDLVEMMEEIVKKNEGNLMCEIYEDLDPTLGQKLSEQTVGETEHHIAEKVKKHNKEQAGIHFPTHLKPAMDNVKGGIKLHSGMYPIQ